MSPVIIRVFVALVTLTAGVSAVGAWNWLGRSYTAGTSVRRECALVTSEAPSADEREILELMRQYGVAQTEHDVAFFERAEADTYTVTAPSGETLTRSEIIAMMLTWKKDTKFAHEGLRAEIYGDTATVNGVMTATPLGEGGGYTNRWQVIYRLSKRSGRWQILSATEVG
jgi:hypothetical protein